MHPKDLVRAWTEAFNRKGAAALADRYDARAVNHPVAERPVEGREAMRWMFTEGFAFAEIVRIVEDLSEGAGWAKLDWRDPLGLRGCGFFQVVAGRIRFQRGCWENLSYLHPHMPPLPHAG